MNARKSLETRFVGFEVEFISSPSEEELTELITFFSEKLGGNWKVSRIFEDEHFYDVEADRISASTGQIFDTAHELTTHELVGKAGISYIGPDFELDNVDLRDDFDVEDHAIAEESKTYDWHLDKVYAKQAWEIPVPDGGSAHGAGVRVGHLDTGYTKHYEYYDDANVNVELGYNFEEDKKDPLEPLDTIGKGHGSATGSILVSGIGKSGNNNGEPYVSGIAPAAEIVPIRVDKNVWWFSPKKDIKGIKYAMHQKCHIISMSRGGIIFGKKLKKATKKATSQGIIVVSAAGNCKPNCSVVHPARYSHVMGVAGTTSSNAPWKGSSNGSKVDICAPGYEIWRARTVKQNGDYFYDVFPSQGTSYSTAIVSGAAALWLAFHGGQKSLAQKLGSVKQIPPAFKYLVTTHGKWAPGNKWDHENFGAGILHIEKLLKEPLPPEDAIQSLIDAEADDESPVKFAQLTEMSKLTADLLEQEVFFYAMTNPDFGDAYSELEGGRIASPEFIHKIGPLLESIDASQQLKSTI